MSPYASALRVMAAAIAATIVPPSQTTPSAWAAANLVEIDGPRAGQTWDPALTPQIAAMLDEFWASPWPVGTVKKPAQVGFTRAIIGFWGFIAAENPVATCMHALPTTELARQFNRDKLSPTIAATPVLQKRIADETTRGKPGSSSLNKVWPGGWLKLTGASSAAQLQGHTIKIVCADEIDQYPANLDDQGSPMSMIDARQKSFHATRNYKKLQGGTPTNKGSSLVESEFEKGDQRYWFMPCPGCGEDFRMTFGGFSDVEGGTGLRFNRQHPFEAHYVTACCGTIIQHWQKSDIVRRGRYKPTCDEPGRGPSWMIDGATILLTTWDKIAETYVQAGDDPEKLKSFFNHWLGESYEEKSDAPDWKILAERREDYEPRKIPADALIVTMGVDVQKLGLYYEMLAWRADRVVYTIDADYIAAEGRDTSDPDDRCWKILSTIFEAPLPDAFGGTRRIDALGVDCRYNASTVYDWVRRHHGAYAIRTMEGWGFPTVKNPLTIDYDWRGKRIRGGAQQWQAGSYNLKARFYAQLKRESFIDEETRDTLWPAAACRFGKFLDERYFRQITCEYVGLDKGGRRIWKQREEDNHYLDCRVLNMALFYGILKAELYTEDHWRNLAANRGVSFDATAPLLARAAPPRAEEPPQAPPKPVAALEGGDVWDDTPRHSLYNQFRRS